MNVKPFVIQNTCEYSYCLNCTVRRMQVMVVKETLSKKHLPDELIDIILWKVYNDPVHSLKRKTTNFYG